MVRGPQRLLPADESLDQRPQRRPPFRPPQSVCRYRHPSRRPESVFRRPPLGRHRHAAQRRRARHGSDRKSSRRPRDAGRRRGLARGDHRGRAANVGVSGFPRPQHRDALSRQDPVHPRRLRGADRPADRREKRPTAPAETRPATRRPLRRLQSGNRHGLDRGVTRPRHRSNHSPQRGPLPLHPADRRLPTGTGARSDAARELQRRIYSANLRSTAAQPDPLDYAHDDQRSTPGQFRPQRAHAFRRESRAHA